MSGKPSLIDVSYILIMPFGRVNANPYRALGKARFFIVVLTSFFNSSVNPSNFIWRNFFDVYCPGYSS